MKVHHRITGNQMSSSPEEFSGCIVFLCIVVFRL
jgi:hypothetical protein